jgi:hypothetical protein
MPNLSARKRDFVYRITGGLCWYCGKTANSIDHMMPVCRGGTNQYGNIVPACRSCNNNKSALTVEEYRLRKPEQELHVFFAEDKKFDPRWPIRCMNWRGKFLLLEDRNWMVNIWRGIRRNRRKARKFLKRLLRTKNK